MLKIVKSVFFFFTLGASLLLVNPRAFATTGYGCDHLTVTIINETNYQFIPDNTLLSQGKIVKIDGSGNDVASSLENIPAGPSSVTYVILVGTEKANSNPLLEDEIEGDLHYSAQLSGQNFRNATIAVHVKKTSCNVSLQSCGQHCRCLYAGNRYNCGSQQCHDNGSSWQWHDDWCKDTYIPPAADQINSSDIAPSTSDTSNLVDKPLYTLSTQPNVNPYFACDEDHASCDGCRHDITKTDAPGCYITLKDNNDIGATSAFAIYPTVLTQLIITFPFNNQSPVAQTMLHSIYNNLNPLKLQSLTTFRVVPVALDTQQETVTFSALCTEPNCADKCASGSCPRP